MPPTRSYSQQLSDQLGDSDPIGLKLFAIGVVGVVLGVGVLISSRILFFQQASPIIRKIIVGAVGAGLPIGLTGGILLIDPDPRLRYIGGGLLSSLGALLLFEVTYPGEWAEYHRVGTFVYVSGSIVLLGLAAWGMRDWFEDDTESTGTKAGSVEASGKEEVDDSVEDTDPGGESVGSDGEIDTATDGSDDDDVSATSQGNHHDDQITPLEIRVKDANAEVRHLKTQLDRPGVSGSDPELDTFEPQVEAVINRIDEMLPEIARLMDQTWALENNLDELRLGLDRVGSETAQSVEHVHGKFPDFRDHDTSHGTVSGNRFRPSARQRPVPSDEPSRASTQQQTESRRKRRTGSASNTGKRADPRYRRSNRSRRTASATRQTNKNKTFGGFVEDNLWIKAVLAVLGILTIVFTSFFVGLMT